MKITLNNKEYTFLIQYQKEEKYRAAFNTLAKKVFGISFEEWYAAGYWNEKYIPYTLFDGEHAVANLSINIMDFEVFGDKERYIQIGTVMTDENYRNQNLSRFLMEKVMEEWGDKCKFVYLYANKSVLGFYPKFGFYQVKEYECFKSIKVNASHGDFEKLNMDTSKNRSMLYDYAKNSKSISKISMQENADLVMFYCTAFLKDSVFYSKSLDVIIVLSSNDNKLQLLDVFSHTAVELEKIIPFLGQFKVSEIVLGFTPKNSIGYEVREVVGDDALFIHGNNTKLFEENKVMFPLLSHA